MTAKIPTMNHYPFVITSYKPGFSTQAFFLFALLLQNWAEIINIMHTQKNLYLVESNLYFPSSFLGLLAITLSNFILRQNEE